VVALGKFLTLQNTGALSQSASLSRIGTPGFTVSGASFAVKDIPAVLKYLQVNNGAELTLVWSLELETEDNMYNAFVDVTDGEVVQLLDWVSDAAYNVFPFGINDPQSGDRQYVQNPANAEASPLGWHSLGAGQESTKTIGNNVIAQENLNGNADYINNYRPDGGANLDFNFPLFLQLQPTEYQDTSITNLFYWNNVIHDLFFVYGFNEEAGNFQETNFGSVGAGGDFVIAHAQDGSGFNNANFATPPDGQKGRMRMYVWTASTPRRDGDLDGGIVMHEYAHGISNRLTGGRTNVGCLGFGEPGGMGEGWGDTFATITRVTASTTRTQNYAMGDYSANDAGGIRNYVYSTNMTTNPSTYNYVVRPGYSGVHAKGEVWAVILYDVFWNMVEANGFDSNWYNVASNAGNVKMLQLIVDGMKLQPCNPNFVQARDAILEADELNYDGANQCTLWRGFAKRGLGTGARFEGVESFDVPAEC
jgi:extracellular elastinolytic metalloproteinase